jgi:hypothetical protein
MMEWKNELSKNEANYDWQACVELLNVVKSNLSFADKLDFTTRVIFLITYWFLEGNYSEEEEKIGLSRLKILFDESFKEYSENADYLFCISVITKLNEYDFGISVEQSDEFISRAILFSPNCQLYKDWLTIHNQQLDLALNEDYYSSFFVTNWKSNKGLLGKYVVDFLISKLYL